MGEHIVAEGGFAGLSYDRTPFNEPQDGQHWTYLYERQVGFAGVWRAPARRKVIFGVKKRVKKITTGFETDNFGKPKNLDFIETFEPVILKMPITKGAKIGIANQYHKTTTDKDGSAGELYIVERFNSLDIFEEP